MERGTTTSDNVENVWQILYGSNDKQMCRLLHEFKYIDSNEYNNQVGFYIYDPRDATVNPNKANLTIGFDQNGAYATAPTRPSDDNGINIATTAFVNNRLPYTIGTWTPTYLGRDTVGEFTYTERNGHYVKIGKLVFINFHITCTCVNVPAGYVRISGLPFVCEKNTVISLNGYATGQIYNGASYMTLQKIVSGRPYSTRFSSTTDNEMYTLIEVGTEMNIFGSGIYRTNS